jgi:hypothetical protein
MIKEYLVGIIDWVNFKTAFEAVWKIILISFIVKGVIILKSLYRASR